MTHEAPDSRITVWFLLALLLITLSAGGMRLYQLDQHGLVSNELFTLRDAMNMDRWILVKSLSYLPTTVSFYLNGIPTDDVGFDEYSSWRRHGIDEFQARLASATLGIVSVPVLAFAALPVVGRRAAVLSALLLTLAIWHLEWSQHARFYVQWFLLFNLSYLIYFSGMRTGSSLRLALAMLFAVLALMCQPIALMIFGIFALDFLYLYISKRKLPIGLWQILIPASGFLVCVFMLACDVMTRTKGFNDFLEREAVHGPLRVGPEHVFKVGLPVVILAVPAAWILWRLNRRLFFYLVMGVAVPILCFSFLAIRHVVHVRYTFVALMPWLLLAAVVLDRIIDHLKPALGLVVAWSPVAILSAAMLMVDIAYYKGGYGYRERYREAFSYVSRHRKKVDLVYSSNTPPAKYYLGDPEVLPMPTDWRMVQSRGRPAWFVVLSNPSDTVNALPLSEQLQLKSVYTNRVMYPQVTVAVYYYEPFSMTDAGRKMPERTAIAGIIAHVE